MGQIRKNATCNALFNPGVAAVSFALTGDSRQLLFKIGDSNFELPCH